MLEVCRVNPVEPLNCCVPGSNSGDVSDASHGISHNIYNHSLRDVPSTSNLLLKFMATKILSILYFNLFNTVESNINTGFSNFL